MTVKSILTTKGRDVTTVGPQATLGEVAHILAKAKIGAVVVTGVENSVLGILSERDIIRALSVNGAAALEHPVSKHMTSKVVTCRETASIHSVMDMMTQGKFRHVPVLENGKLVGLISIGDVVKRRVADIEAEHHAMKQYIAMA